MNVPLPHAAFPLGDTIPFTVTMLTDEKGEKWYRSPYESGISIQGIATDESGQNHYINFSPVSGVSPAYAGELPTNGLRKGTYRYAITLNQTPQGSPYAAPLPPRRYTLKRGSFTLY